MQACRISNRVLLRRVSLCVLIAAVVLFTNGCGRRSGPARGEVSGKVTVDAQPLAEGVITFLPTGTTKGPSAGAAVSNGQYRIPADKGPLVGDYRVEIRAQKKTGQMIEQGSPEPPGTMIELTVEALPAKYNSDSTLQREIKAGSNALDFDLQTK